MRLSASSASTGSSGGSASALSSITSAATPPWPTIRIGPNTGSSAAPRISSTACGRLTIGCTAKPSMRAPGAAVQTLSMHRRHGVAHRLLGAEFERHAADVALVRDVARQDLHRDRKADPRRRMRRLGGIEHDLGRHDGDAVGRQHALGLGLGQHAALLRQRAVDRRAHQVGVGRAPRGSTAACAAARAGRGGRHDVHEAAHRAQRRVVGRHAGIVQHLAAGVGIAARRSSSRSPARPCGRQRRRSPRAASTGEVSAVGTLIASTAPTPRSSARMSSAAA